MNYPKAKPRGILLIKSQPIEIKKTPIILIEVFDVVPPGIEQINISDFISALYIVFEN